MQLLQCKTINLFSPEPWSHKLHWPPVSYGVKFKLCCLVHTIYYGRSPTYLTEAVQSASTSRSRSGLRSSSTYMYLTDGLLTTMTVHEVRRACVHFPMLVMPPGTHCLWQYWHRGWSCQISKPVEITLLQPLFSVPIELFIFLALLLIFVDYFLRVLRHVLYFCNAPMFLFL